MTYTTVVATHEPSYHHTSFEGAAHNLGSNIMFLRPVLALFPMEISETFFSVYPLKERTASIKLWTTDYGLRTTDYGQWTTDYGLRTTDYGLRTTDYGLRTTDYGLRTESKTWIEV